MIHRIISTRPNTDIPFFAMTEEQSVLKEQGHGINRFVKNTTVTYSEDRLTQIIDIEYETEDDFRAISASEVNKQIGQQRNKYCSDNGIRLVRGVLTI
jgi:nicotinamide mononucleotide (NMN) deamidase PncC